MVGDTIRKGPVGHGPYSYASQTAGDRSFKGVKLKSNSKSQTKPTPRSEI